MNAKTINPITPANYTPQLGNYRPLEPFRYWCQKTLPLIYDDSLSYYELLGKVVDYLNKTMEDVDTLHTDVTNLHAAYILLQEYVNAYFSTLDVQSEINNKLDDMADSGELNALFNPRIDQLFQDSYNTLSNKISSIGTGTPQGVYETLDNLKTAFPNGNNGVYVVANENSWYYWKNNSWTRGGDYVTANLGVGSVTPSNISASFNGLNSLQAITEYGITNVEGNVQLFNNENGVHIIELDSRQKPLENNTDSRLGMYFKLCQNGKPQKMQTVLNNDVTVVINLKHGYNNKCLVYLSTMIDWNPRANYVTSVVQLHYGINVVSFKRGTNVEGAAADETLAYVGIRVDKLKNYNENYILAEAYVILDNIQYSSAMENISKIGKFSKCYLFNHASTPTEILLNNFNVATAGLTPISNYSDNTQLMAFELMPEYGILYSGNKINGYYNLRVTINELISGRIKMFLSDVKNPTENDVLLDLGYLELGDNYINLNEKVGLTNVVTGKEGGILNYIIVKKVDTDQSVVFNAALELASYNNKNDFIYDILSKTKYVPFTDVLIKQNNATQINEHITVPVTSYSVTLNNPMDKTSYVSLRAADGYGVKINADNEITKNITFLIYFNTNPNKELYAVRISSKTDWNPTSTNILVRFTAKKGLNVIKIPKTGVTVGSKNDTELQYFIFSAEKGKDVIDNIKIAVIYDEMEVISTIYDGLITLNENAAETDARLNDAIEKIQEISGTFDNEYQLVSWGDSLTAGAGGGGTTYTGIIAEELGLTRVLNGGVGGETAYTIAARQGANAALLQANKTSFSANIPCLFGTAEPLLQGGENTVNPVIIDGTEYNLTRQSNGNYNVNIQTANYDRLIFFGGSNVTADITIIFVGQNGPSGEEKYNIIRQMVAKTNNNNFIVVGLSSGTTESRKNDTQYYTQMYGTKFFNAGEEISKKGMYLVGLTPTSTELSDMSIGKIPASLLHDKVHMNANGYTAFGKLLAGRIKALGYDKIIQY